MSYIAQSITSGEKIIHIGRFHWIYTLSALFWVVFGFGGCMAIIAAASAWDVHSDMRQLYTNLPSNMFWDAWQNVVAQKGGYVAVIRDQNWLVRLCAFGVLILGAGLFAHMMIIRATTEIAVTTNRFVLKEGIVARHVDEMNIDRIESVHVIQSFLGRMLNYGTVMVRGMGIGEITLPPIMHPVTMRNAIEKAREVHAGGHE